MLLLDNVGPVVYSRAWLEVILVAFVLSSLIAAGCYRPLPRVIGSQQTARVAKLGFASVVGFFVLLRFSYQQNVFGAGVMLLIGLAVPLCLFVADQMTGHMIHWLAAEIQIPYQGDASRDLVTMPVQAPGAAAMFTQAEIEKSSDAVNDKSAECGTVTWSFTPSKANAVPE